MVPNECNSIVYKCIMSRRAAELPSNFSVTGKFGAPLMNVTADMPITRYCGEHVITLRTASSTLPAMTSVAALKLSLLTASAFGVKMRL